MGILINENTRVLIQGITGRDGSFHLARMLEYGTKVVGGVTPGKGGQTVEGVPVFDTVEEACRETGANAAVIFVAAPFAPGAIIESVYNEIPLAVCITEGIPVREMVRINAALKGSRTRLVGPNCPGVITAGKCKVGIIPGHICAAGPVGVVSRSGTLTYEVAYQLSRAGIGQTTVIGIGGDPIVGTTFLDVLEMFENDPETRVVALVGEIGGTDEERAAEYIRTMSKPVVSFISGRTAPPGKRMGHAGAIIAAGVGAAESKIAALEAAGAPVAGIVSELVGLVKERLD
jgi:succinyl-CoA synthetase alpha subunit